MNLLEYKLALEKGNFHSGMAEAEKATAGLDAAVNKIGRTLLSVFAVHEVIDFGKELIHSFDEADKASAQVRASITSTNGAAGKSLEELEHAAKELSKTTLFSKAQTLGAESLLLTFTKISGVIYDEAIPAIQNLAQKQLHGNLDQASIMVGKALNDPIRGMLALRKAGISFDDSQRAQIKTLVESGHLYQAQKIILKELETEFGGSAAAAAKAGTGGFTVLKNRLEEIKESFGELIVKGFNKFKPAILEGLDVLEEMTANLGPIEEGFEAIWDAVKPLVTSLDHLVQALFSTGDGALTTKDAMTTLGDVLNDFAAALAPIIDATAWIVNLLADLAPVIVPVIAAFVAYESVLMINAELLWALNAAEAAWTVITGEATIAQWALNVAMTANPIGLVVAGLAALGVALYEAYEHFDAVRKVVDGLWQVFKDTVQKIVYMAKNELIGVAEIFAGIFTLDMGSIKDGMEHLRKTFDTYVSIGMQAGDSFMKGYNESLAKAAVASPGDDWSSSGRGKGLPSWNDAKGNKVFGKKDSGPVGGGGATPQVGVASGTSVRNVTVHIAKQQLSEHLTISGTEKSPMDFAKMLQKELMSMVRDAEIAL